MSNPSNQNLEQEADTLKGPYDLLTHIWRTLGGHAEMLDTVVFKQSGHWPSIFPVPDLAAAALGAAGAALAELIQTHTTVLPQVVIDQRLSSLWSGWSFKPIGWVTPDAWDAIAGDYATADGWIRLHTNAPHHR